jgi:hypothetical protein
MATLLQTPAHKLTYHPLQSWRCWICEAQGTVAHDQGDDCLIRWLRVEQAHWEANPACPGGKSRGLVVDQTYPVPE